MVSLGNFLLKDRSKLGEAETLLLEALQGCRQALDRNHLATDGALAGLAALYSLRNDMKKLAPVLIESLAITRSRYGPENGLTAGANQAVGAFFVHQHEFAKAEPYLRETLACFVKPEYDPWHGLHVEGLLGTCLVGQKKYTEAEKRLLAACKGMKVRQGNVPPAYKPALAGVMERLIQLYDAWGKKDKAEEWRRERADLVLADPFAPP
jgi:hypothetical protein